jgi:hypothetical protein
MVHSASAAPRASAHRDVDLLIYDPLLTAVNARGDRYSQVIDTALAHPDIPMLLAWSPAKVPEFGTLRGIRNLAPHVHAAAHDPAGLLRQIHDALVPTQQPIALDGNGELIHAKVRATA